jgi:hypothetical protein
MTLGLSTYSTSLCIGCNSSNAARSTKQKLAGGAACEKRANMTHNLGFRLFSQEGLCYCKAIDIGTFGVFKWTTSGQVPFSAISSMNAQKRSVEVNHDSRRSYAEKSQEDQNAEVWNQVRQHAGLFFRVAARVLFHHRRSGLDEACFFMIYFLFCRQEFN